MILSYSSDCDTSSFSFICGGLIRLVSLSITLLIVAFIPSPAVCAAYGPSPGFDPDLATSLVTAPNANCGIIINRVDVSSCYFDEDAQESRASVSVEISWMPPAPGPVFMDDLTAPRLDSIAVTINGETKFVFREAPYIDRGQNVIGYYELASPQLIRFIVPADGATNQPVTAGFTTPGSCTSTATYDRPAPCPNDPCVTGPGTIGGMTFEDLNTNGILDPGEPVGIPGIEVNIYGCDDEGSSVLLGTTTTNEDGDYYFDGDNTSPAIMDGENYRIEFVTPPPSPFLPSCGETGGHTSVQFATAPGCGVNLGFINPEDNCQVDPDILLTCYVGGRHTATAARDFGTIVTYPITAPDGNFGLNSGNNSGPSNVYYGYHNQTGAIWGMAHRADDNLLFSGALLRRQSGLGPLGLGGIYVTDLDLPPGTNGLNAPTQNFLDLTFGGTFNFGSVPPRTDLATTPTSTNNRDSQAFPLVATVGIGDVEISANGNELYVVNLFDRHLYVIDISGYDGTVATLPTVGDVARYPIPNPCGGTGELRPWALLTDNGRVLVGAVCDASITDNRSDMRAYVFAFDPASGSFSSSPVLDIPLNYPRGAGTLDPGLWQHNVWEPWSNDWQGNIPDQNDWYKIVDGMIAGQDRIIYDYPQPILTDISVYKDQSIVLIFNDRTSYQVGNLERAPTGPTYMGNTAAGDILRAFSPNGMNYILESEGASGGLVGSGPGNFQGPGYGEFFDDNFFTTSFGTQLVHSELVVGGGAIVPGSGQIVVATADPTNNTNFANGTRKYNIFTGQVESSYSVYTSAGQANSATFGKTAGIGDVELRCDPLDKLEIGNYVWIDSNGDGIQDPCEETVPDVSVSLYNVSTGMFEQVTTTNASGQYYFNDLDPFTEYSVVFGYDYTDASSQWDLSTMILSANGDRYFLTTANTGQGVDPDLNDSDVTLQDVGSILTQYPVIDLRTTDVSNHTYDLGLIPVRFDLALQKTIDLASSPPPYAQGQDVTFNLLIENQGTVDATDIVVTDYVPSGMTFDPLMNSGWSGPATAPIFTIPTLDAGQVTTIQITLTINPGQNGTLLTNNAEIISADDADPNTPTPTDEDGDLSIINGGIDATNEVATNDEIEDDGFSPNLQDGNGTDNPNDADDYDPEQIQVGVFDLALQKTLDNPSIFYRPGFPVSFTVTVINQGNLTAYDVRVADYFVANELSFVSLTNTPSSGFTDNGNGGFTIDQIDAGASVTVTLNFTIDPDFTGTQIINNAEIISGATTPGGPTALDQDSPLANTNNGTTNELDTDNDIADDSNGGTDNPNDEDDYDPAPVNICPNNCSNFPWDGSSPD